MPGDIIELDGGVVTASILHARRGPTATRKNIGEHRFFVSCIEPEGTWCLWDGADYCEAIVVAENARRSFGITAPVRDNVLTGGARMADAALENLVAQARALVAAVTADDSGTMVGNQWVGGNGGLICRETLRVADQLRLALDAYDQAANSPVSEVRGE